jgi:hypothetical protein
VEYPTLQISKQGQALEAFALAHGSSEAPEEPEPRGEPKPGEEPEPHDEPGETSTLQPASTGTTATALTAALFVPPVAANAPARAGARVALSSSLIRVRGAAAHVKLSCTGIGRCIGRLALVMRITSTRGGRRRLRNLTIGSAAFSLASPATVTITVDVSSRARELLRGIRAPRTRLSGVLAITQTSPGSHPTESEEVQLIAAK